MKITHPQVMAVNPTWLERSRILNTDLLEIESSYDDITKKLKADRRVYVNQLSRNLSLVERDEYEDMLGQVDADLFTVKMAKSSFLSEAKRQVCRLNTLLDVFYCNQDVTEISIKLRVRIEQCLLEFEEYLNKFGVSL